MDINESQKLTRLMQNELADAAKAIAAKHGVKFVKTFGRYSDTDVTVKIDFLIDAAKKEAEKKSYAMLIGKHLGFVPDDRVEYRGVTYKVTGYSPKGLLEVVRESDGVPLRFRRDKNAAYEMGYAYLKKLVVA